jgi:hypothetical protein
MVVRAHLVFYCQIYDVGKYHIAEYNLSIETSYIANKIPLLCVAIPCGSPHEYCHAFQ